MAIGTNLSATNPSRTLQKIFEKLGWSSEGPAPMGKVLKKDGAPANNTEADDPGEKGVLIWDYTNDQVYICTAYTNATSFTVVQIS